MTFFPFQLDSVAVLVLALVALVSVTTQVFARRYLRGDARAPRFHVGATLLTLATAGLATANSLLVLALCWTISGVAVLLLVGLYWPQESAKRSVRVTALAFLIGDGALWAAVVISAAAWGASDLRSFGPSPAEADPAGPTTQLVATLLCVAALARSAGLPFSRWLPTTLAAPTPVSALLHAGVVNAGGVLLLRTSGVVTASTAALWIAFVAGALTCVWGTAIALARPDVKGSLVGSTIAQMGFMIMTCGLGAFAAALFHLIGHGLYKSTLFLSSGSAVGSSLRHSAAPPKRAQARGVRMTGLAVAALTTGAALVASAAWLYPGGLTSGSALLLAFAWVTAASAIAAWYRRGMTAPRVVAGLLAAAALPLAYVALLAAVSAWVKPDLPEANGALPAWLVFVALALFAALAAVRAARGSALHRRLWLWALAAGHVAPAAPGTTRPRPEPNPASVSLPAGGVA